jgi:ribosomal protein L27
LIVSIGYDEISMFNDHCLFLRNDGKISYLLLSERKEIKLIE